MTIRFERASEGKLNHRLLSCKKYDRLTGGINGVPRDVLSSVLSRGCQIVANKIIDKLRLLANKATWEKQQKEKGEPYDCDERQRCQEK